MLLNGGSTTGRRGPPCHLPAVAALPANWPQITEAPSSRSRPAVHTAWSIAIEKTSASTHETLPINNCTAASSTNGCLGGAPDGAPQQASPTSSPPALDRRTG